MPCCGLPRRNCALPELMAHHHYVIENPMKPLAYWTVGGPKDDLWLGRAVPSLALAGFALLATALFSQVFGISIILGLASTVLCMVKWGRVRDQSSRRNRELRAAAGSRPKRRGELN